VLALPYMPEGKGGATEGVGGGSMAGGVKAAWRAASNMPEPLPRQQPLLMLTGRLSMVNEIFPMAPYIQSY
jgi:hypothetical protein